MMSYTYTVCDISLYLIFRSCFLICVIQVSFISIRCHLVNKSLSKPGNRHIAVYGIRVYTVFQEKHPLILLAIS